MSLTQLKQLGKMREEHLKNKIAEEEERERKAKEREAKGSFLVNILCEGVLSKKRKEILTSISTLFIKLDHSKDSSLSRHVTNLPQIRSDVGFRG